PGLVRKPIPPVMLDALRARFGDRISTTEAVRAHHGRDESAYDPMLPDAVVFAQTTEEVAAVAKLCFEHEIPLIPYGAGSS
ncbi:FAD-binding protein, partial [Acinetobacter baumannii]